VVVLTRDSALKFLGEVTVAPITTTVRDIPSEVYLHESDRMPMACAVNLDHIQTVSKARLGPLITTLPEEKMADIGSALRFALGL
jgi:mRNA interferase MazF